MKEVIYFAILAMISYLLMRVFIWSGKDNYIDAKEAIGIIRKIIDGDG